MKSIINHIKAPSDLGPPLVSIWTSHVSSDSGGIGAAGASGVGGSATAAGCGEKHQDEAGATAVENGQNGEVTGFHAILMGL